MTRPPAVHEFPQLLPRHAFSPRDAARAGDVWRAFQEAAVEASTRAGWAPDRYRREGTAFIVREMTVRHGREVRYGEETVARTWVWRFRREMLSTREVRLVSGDEVLAAATQQWVHVDARLRPTRASQAMLEAFPPYEEGGTTTMPGIVALDSAERAAGPATEHRAPHTFAFECWHTWMDPLGHVNHPAYVDFCEEALARVAIAQGIDPVAIQPVAEHVAFRAGLRAPTTVSVETSLAGRTEEGDVACRHRILAEDGTLAATATTVRRLHGRDAAELLRALT